MINWLIETQTWLYEDLSRGVTSTSGLPGLVTLIMTAFLFGGVHALMPGHGKSVLVSYHLGRPSRVIDGIASGVLLSVVHVGLAVVLVLGGIRLISHSIADAGRAPLMQAISAALVILIGGCLVFQAMRRGNHHSPQNGRALAMFAGMVPCPLTTFILTYALAHDRLAIGLTAVAAMLCGVILTLVSVSLVAVLLRQKAAFALERSERWRHHFGLGLELASGSAVILLGVMMLVGTLARS